MHPSQRPAKGKDRGSNRLGGSIEPFSETCQVPIAPRFAHLGRPVRPILGFCDEREDRLPIQGFGG